MFIAALFTMLNMPQIWQHVSTYNVFSNWDFFKT